MKSRTHPVDLDKTKRTEGDLSSEPSYPVKEDGAGREDYAQYVRDLWDRQDEVMSVYHRVWTQNLLFLVNRQWWRPQKNGEWAPEEVPSWREQPTSNITLAYFKTALAKATKNRPAWMVKPSSGDPGDIQAAELAEEVLEAKWQELTMGKVLRRAVSWVLATGNVFVYPYWDTDTGKTVELTVPMQTLRWDMVGYEYVDCPCDEDGEPILNEDGSPDLTAEPAVVDQGDVGIKVYSPFQVRVNPDAEADEDVTWAIIAEVMDLRTIRERWPETSKDAKAEDVGVLGDHDKILGMAIGSGDTMENSLVDDERDNERPQAIVLYYHEKPSAAFPDGRYWVTCNDDVLLEEPTELPDGIWPALIHMGEIEIPGRFYAASTLESVVGLNREYNELNGRIKEHHKLMTRGKWIVERTTGLKKGMITTQPGEVLVVNPGTSRGVTQADIRPLPAPVYQERDRILGDFEMVSGIHKVSMGSPPPGVTAGVAFMQLQEADDTDLGPLLATIEECMAALGNSIIQIVRDKYTEDRLVHVIGPNNKYMVREFQGADLDGAADVAVQQGSAFPWSKTAQQSMFMQLAQQMPQLFTDANGQFDKTKFARLLPLGGMEPLTEHEDIDIAEALREQEMFEVSTEKPQVEWYQNHDIHYQQHVRLLKSARFKDWDEESQKEFVAHVQAHDFARKRDMMQMMSMMQGGGPNGGPGGPPEGQDTGGFDPTAPPEEMPGRPVEPMSENNAFGGPMAAEGTL